MSIPEFDDLRYKYEFGNRTIESLCAEHGFLISELSAYAKKSSWEAIEYPDIDDPVAVANFYSLARRRLTLEMTSRAMSTWAQVTAIENKLLKKTHEALSNLQTSADSMPGMELSRIAKVLSSIQESNKLYAESIATPAIVDKDLKGLLEAAGKSKATNWVVEVVHTALSEHPELAPTSTE